MQRKLSAVQPAAPLSRTKQLIHKTLDHARYTFAQLEKNNPLDQFILAIARVIETTLALNKCKLPFKNTYTLDEPHPMAFKKYIEFIAQFLKKNSDSELNVINPEDLVFALIYIDRFFAANKKDFLNACNAHILLFVAIMLAHKYNDDIPFDNKAFSYIFKMDLRLLNSIEALFLETIQYDCFISEETYLSYQKLIFGFPASHLEVTINNHDCHDVSLFFPSLRIMPQVDEPKDVLKFDKQKLQIVQQAISVPSKSLWLGSPLSSTSSCSSQESNDSECADTVAPLFALKAGVINEKMDVVGGINCPIKSGLSRTVSGSFHSHMIFSPKSKVLSHHSEEKNLDASLVARLT